MINGVKKPTLAVFVLITALMAVGLLTAQDMPTPRAEITGVDPSSPPTTVVSVNVYDSLGQPVSGLTEADFTLIGDLASRAQIINVDSISSDNLPFSVVLLVDVSSSMADLPIRLARQAARAFVDTIRPIDSVALMTFGNDIRIVQDYTSDKDALYAAIDSLQAFGQTALYQGAFDAVALASNAPNTRRAVIILSDGAEFGGISNVGRDAARASALARGVPVYTIGIGFGIDRSYLQELASATNARFYESPDLSELTEIYTNLARLLSSQYIVTLNTASLPLDGTVYPLALRVQTPEGEVVTPAGTLRMPIPAPIVDLGGSYLISEPTTITPQIRADDPIISVRFGLADLEAVTVFETVDTSAPFAIEIDPEAFPPGGYTLFAAAQDADGDIGRHEVPLDIAALPSRIAIDPAPASLGAISTPTTFTLTITGQTPPVAVRYRVGSVESLLEAPYTFTIDPMTLVPGAAELSIDVANQGGVVSSQAFPLRIADLPPRVTVEGIEPGQLVSQERLIRVTAVSQTPASVAFIGIGDRALEQRGEFYALDPRDWRPGAQTLRVRVVNASNQAVVDIPFIVDALPPIIFVDGIAPGDVLTANQLVTLTFDSQTPVTRVAVLVDGIDLAQLVREPFIFGINVLDYAPGEHTLRIIADNAGGRSSTLDIPFSISPAPAATATSASIRATATSLQATIYVQQTAVAVSATAQQATAVAAQATAQQATAFAQATSVQATQFAQATSAQATQFVQQTAVAAEATAQQATVFAQSTAQQATQFAQATAAQATVFAQSTAVAAQATAQQATAFAQATSSQATADAVRTQAAAEATNAQATQFVQQTQIAVTAAAQQTAVRQTQDAQSTAERATAIVLTQTQILRQIQETATAQAATSVLQTQTQQVADARATATVILATATAVQEQINVQRTQAQETAVIVAATQTEAARPTATLTPSNTPTPSDTPTWTLTPSDTPTNTPTPTPSDTPTNTPTPTDTPTWTATPTDTPTNTLTPTPTENVPATETMQALIIARLTQAFEATATRATATQAAQDAQRTRQAELQGTISAATRAVLATNAAVAQAQARATQDVRGTRAALTATVAAGTQIAADATQTELARPTATPTITPSATQTPSDTPSLTFTPTPTETPSPTATATLTPTPTETPSPTPTLTASNTFTPTPDVEATQTLIAALTQTSESISATASAEAAQTIAAINTASARSTAEAQREATLNARATSNAEATVAMALAALGTVTAEAEETQEATSTPAATETPLPSPTTTPPESTATEPPTLTPIGTLTLIEIGTTPPATDFAPLAVVIVIVLLILLLVFLMARRRISRG